MAPACGPSPPKDEDWLQGKVNQLAEAAGDLSTSETSVCVDLGAVMCVLEWLNNRSKGKTQIKREILKYVEETNFPSQNNARYSYKTFPVICGQQLSRQHKRALKSSAPFSFAFATSRPSGPWALEARVCVDFEDRRPKKKGRIRQWRPSVFQKQVQVFSDSVLPQSTLSVR